MVKARAGKPRRRRSIDQCQQFRPRLSAPCDLHRVQQMVPLVHQPRKVAGGPLRQRRVVGHEASLCIEPVGQIGQLFLRKVRQQAVLYKAFVAGELEHGERHKQVELVERSIRFIAANRRDGLGAEGATIEEAHEGEGAL